MSYSIIFKEILVRYKDKLLLFERSGCNNDDCGRKDTDFTLQIFNNDNEYISYYSKWLGITDTEIKMNSKFITLDKYSKFMLKKLKNCLSLEDFNKQYESYFRRLDFFRVESNDKVLEKIKFEDYDYYSLRDKYVNDLKLHVLIYREYTDLSFEDLLKQDNLNKLHISIYTIPKKYRK